MRSPWAGATLRFIADPAAALDPAAVPDWPAWSPLDAVLARPAIRGRLGRWLAPDDDTVEMLDRLASPPQRLVLIPAEEAVDLVRMLAAWIDAPRIGTLIRRRDIDAVRAAVGENAFVFAERRAALFGRPGAALLAAVDAVTPMADPLDPARLLPRGAAALGLAIGSVPPGTAARLRLRRPAPLWATIVDHCRSDAAASADAWTCVRRLIRDQAPVWSTWFS
ncbi:MAG: hypothetical protein JSS43_26170 [Proteobacteria bacterium]|nr:hypothetical protein [Pseudomonadota bacterium]